MSSILRRFSRRATPQGERATAEQVRNSAGGYSFEVSPLVRVRRFLILGTESGSFYTNATQLTVDNAENLLEVIASDGIAVVDEIVDVSTRGLAPKVDPALFALAAASAADDDATRAYALVKLPIVARTATHLFQFLAFRKQFRGVSRSLRTAVSRWYTDREVDALAYQVAKYRRREGYTHRDVLRIAHPVTTEPARRAVFEWVTRGETDAALPRLLEGFEKAQLGAGVPALVREYGLSWDMLPDAALADPETWHALLDGGMPQTALLRQLPRLTRLGVLTPLGGRTAEVVAQLTDRDRLRAARLHPMRLLVAGKAYASGQSASARWAPVPAVIDALNDAFYAAFHTVEAAGRRTLIGLDVSASMRWPVSVGPAGPTAAEVGAALALVVSATEPESHVFGFAAEFRELGITPRMRLNDAMARTNESNFGRTDAALAIRYAETRGLAVDTFVVITDNETWVGPEHPFQALRRYRAATGIPARLVVLAVTSTGFTIADPSDSGMLDVAGFSADVPTLVTEFSRGF
ncbi:TROVE domain-containing protein [Herbiconiux sp. P16]|uniref:TROVE domain-containing protein n=1 Tax=Herbiconiux wuyangfengii TaxID=3342794 RepID=UPI0035BB4F7F